MVPQQRLYLQQPYSVTNPVNQPTLYDEGVGLPMGSTRFNTENGVHQARGAQFYNPPLQNRNAGAINLDLKFPKSLTRTQKRIMLRERADGKRELRGAVVSKSRFFRKATENKSSDDSDDLCSDHDNQGNKTIDFHVGKFHISVDCNTDMVIFPEKFKYGVLMKKVN
ncbi:hypothetical protein F511_09233 [Dorcoceras hygrometricum]|uniref:Uncharacterized protein n=1 Tax=Dorcoceras hygrometricum TaxID=472368 RepID=A0A2Z7ANN0_9LAMI|nr:hypothetical protein F511_09233 [Dorcoceras hygrometricum]